MKSRPASFGQFETCGLLENIAGQRHVLVAKLTAMFATENNPGKW